MTEIFESINWGLPLFQIIRKMNLSRFNTSGWINCWKKTLMRKKMCYSDIRNAFTNIENILKSEIFIRFSLVYNIRTIFISFMFF